MGYPIAFPIGKLRLVLRLGPARGSEPQHQKGARHKAELITSATAVDSRIAKLPDCKPVSVPLRAAVIPLGRPLLTGSSDLPGSRAGRAAPPPLFGLAPRGVYPAGGITPAAVRSYRTISPLPHTRGMRRYIFCGTFRRALRPSRPLAGTLPCGDRTFLPRFRRRLPIRQLRRPYCRIFKGLCASTHWGRVGTGTNPIKFLQISTNSGVFYNAVCLTASKEVSAGRL